ncbi:cytochrome c oxidase subunit 3 [Pyruvatibacter sp.]|uniref:cytochrome c oxidase subunit 3 n=1 Tax=unclassified Pyruvatibacter TaxID=2618840 RepID=UPI00296888F3|nr:cytochrome c oxidase subunit 3 [Alphaproteobacteria bacterium]
MADSHAKEHDYHLVDPSPWPFVGSIGAFIMMVGGVVYMKPDPVLGMSGPWVFYIGLAMVLYTMVGWWRDVTKEAEHQGHHTPVVQLHHRYGMVLFIASEVMFFVAWFWAYFDASLFTGEVAQYARVEATGGVWPPVGIETFDPFHLPLMNTLILLTSGTTVTWAHHALQNGDREGLKWGLICTVVLGVLFSALQAYEYSHAAFGFSGSIYGATFYMATGFHGFHVIIGTIFLAVCLFRAYAGHFTPQHHFGFEAAAWYWHFVDVVWLFLFAAIYVWGAGTPAAH